MQCPKCGTQNPENTQLCRACSWVLTGAPAQPNPNARTCGLAIAAIVCAVLSPLTCFVTAIPAVVLGIVALSKIAASAGQLRGRGLAIAGIAVPAASLPVFALLMAILMPALARTRQIAYRLYCGTNMSGIDKAMRIYAIDYDALPTCSQWCDLLIEHADVDPKAFRCKGASQGPCNYAMNHNIEKLTVPPPPDMVLLFETHPGWNQSGGPEILTTDNHQGDGCNVVFCDGHAEFVRTNALTRLRWTPD